MQKYFKNFGTYLLTFIGAMWLGLLASFAKLPIMLVVDLSRLGERIVESVLHIAVSCLWLFLAAKTVGYKSREWKPAVSVLSMAAVFAIQQALSSIFRYAVYISGGATMLTYSIFLGNNPLYAEAPDFIAAGVPKWGYHVVMLALAVVFYLPAVLLGERFGRKKREKDRRALTGAQQNEKEQ